MKTQADLFKALEIVSHTLPDATEAQALEMVKPHLPEGRTIDEVKLQFRPVLAGKVAHVYAFIKGQVKPLNIGKRPEFTVNVDLYQDWANQRINNVDLFYTSGPAVLTKLSNEDYLKALGEVEAEALEAMGHDKHTMIAEINAEKSEYKKEILWKEYSKMANDSIIKYFQLDLK